MALNGFIINQYLNYYISHRMVPKYDKHLNGLTTWYILLGPITTLFSLLVTVVYGVDYIYNKIKKIILRNRNN